MRVLVLDDSKAIRMIVTRTLRQTRFADDEVTEGGDGTDGLRLVAEHAPDLALGAVHGAVLAA